MAIELPNIIRPNEAKHAKGSRVAPTGRGLVKVSLERRLEFGTRHAQGPEAISLDWAGRRNRLRNSRGGGRGTVRFCQAI